MVKIDEPELLDEFLSEQSAYSEDFKALVLRLLHQSGGHIEQVSGATGVPCRTLYAWVEEWNQAKKKPSESPGPWRGLA